MERIDSGKAIAALTRRFLLDYPQHAAEYIETLPLDEVADVLAGQPAAVLAPVTLYLAPDVAARLCLELEQTQAAGLIAELAPNDAARLLAAMRPSERALYLGLLGKDVTREIERVLEYPADSAGRLMETRVPHFRGSATVGATLDRLRQTRTKATRSLFIVDAENRLSGRVSIQELALAPDDTRLDALS